MEAEKRAKLSKFPAIIPKCIIRKDFCHTPTEFSSRKTRSNKIRFHFLKIKNILIFLRNQQNLAKFSSTDYCIDGWHCGTICFKAFHAYMYLLTYFSLRTFYYYRSLQSKDISHLPKHIKKEQKKTFKSQQ